MLKIIFNYDCSDLFCLFLVIIEIHWFENSFNLIKFHMFKWSVLLIFSASWLWRRLCKESERDG